MTLFALIFALVLEQTRPLQQRAAVDDFLGRLCARAGELYDDGSFASGRLAWLLVVGLGSLLTLLAHFLLLSLHSALAFVFSAGVLYLALGFRRDEGMFTDIQRALSDEEVGVAAQRLGDWTGRDHAGASGGELASTECCSGSWSCRGRRAS
jgi:adenosylcobinamide-phosphate synthase